MKKISLTSRRLLAVIALAVMLIAAAVPAVSANEVLNYHKEIAEVIHGETNATIGKVGVGSGALYMNCLHIRNSELLLQKTVTAIEHTQIGAEWLNYAYLPQSDWTRVTISDGSIIGTADYGFFKFSSGGTSYLKIWVENIEWSSLPPSTSGSKVLSISGGRDGFLYPYMAKSKFGGIPETSDLLITPGSTSSDRGCSGSVLNTFTATFHNKLDVTSDTYNDIFTLTRDVGGIQSTSILYIKPLLEDAITDDNNIDVILQTRRTQRPYEIALYSPAMDKWYLNTTIGETTDYTVYHQVIIYVRNSQTGALLADSHIVISANVDNEFYEVINKTLPSGIYTGNLQPTGGGLPNPDFYRLIATAEGYNSIMPYIDFEADIPTTIYAYLNPIGGGPEDENKTFIDFYVRDLAANAISGATVNFGKYTLITNSAGYTMFEVDKSKTYSWTVSKSGYGSVTGNAVIGSDARHTINSVIAPAVTPTTPTPIPTSTPISPTPTMTAPTGEPVSNWLEWFAAHFGRILGGGVEIGKIFMWLCFAVPVGVYVAKEAKAGAAGFMAGAGVVTLFFVLIGWVPIWLLVFIALIIGLLYAKVFNNSDNGGGR